MPNKKTHHYHQNKKCLHDSNFTNLDLDMQMSIHDVAWKHTEEIIQWNYIKFSSSSATLRNWNFKQEVREWRLQGQLLHNSKRKCFQKGGLGGRSFPCPYNFRKFISIKLTLFDDRWRNRLIERYYMRSWLQWRTSSQGQLNSELYPHRHQQQIQWQQK